MNALKKILFIIFWLGLANVATAQDDGTIRGTVIDNDTGEPLYGVTVMVKGTPKGTSADFDGKFSLNLDPGSYDLKFSYVSYSPITIEGVEVSEDEVTVIDNIRLQQSVEEMEEVVVSAEVISNSETAMLTMKRKSPNVLDGISSESFGKIGVSDAASALKKVTGVSVEGGKYVYVRGLGDRYTNTMLNTVEIPSLDPNKNSLQIDIFPTSLIDNMVISKTAVAEMPANFTGGIVNIETKDFPEKPIFDISVSTGLNPKMHFNGNYLSYKGSSTDFLGFDNGARDLPAGSRGGDVPTPINASDEEVFDFVNSFNPTLGPKQNTNDMDYSLGLSLGNQFDLSKGRKLGYIFSAKYKKSTKHYNNYRFGEYQTQSDPSEYELIYATKQDGTVSERNILFGGLAGLAFKTPNSKYKLTGMHLQNGNTESANFFIDNSQNAPGQSGYLGDSYNLEYSERGITNFLLNGTHYFDDAKWEVDWRLSPTFSNMRDPDIRKTTYTLGGTNNDDPTFNAGAGGFPSRIWRNMDEVNLVGRADVSRKYKLFGESAKFKFGGSHVYKQRDYEILSFNMAFFGSTPKLNGDPSEILVDENIYGSDDGTIYYQSGNNDPNPNAYSSNVNNSAVYISNEFMPFKDFKMILGLRAEQYIQRHTGRDALFAQGGNGNNLDNEKVLDSIDLFPSANLTYFLSDRQNLRFSYSRTIARPSFKELSFAQILDPVSDRIFNGGLFSIGEWDGNLRESNINNLDLRWERFFNKGQMFSASLFYKKFEDPIELVRIQVQQTSSEFQPRNVGNGKVYGAEFEFRKSLDFLTLDYFSISSNITLVESVIDMTQQEFDARKRREKNGQTIDDIRKMAGQAPYIINAGLQYDNPSISLDAGLFYNVKGETLTVVGGGLFPDVYSEPYHNLKFNLNKSFGDGRYSVNISVSNILNDVQQEFYQGFRASDQVFESYRPHTTGSIGFKYSFK